MQFASCDDCMNVKRERQFVNLSLVKNFNGANKKCVFSICKDKVNLKYNNS